MRHRLFLLSIGCIATTEHGMPHIKWRKGKRWSTKPVGIIEPHKVHGDHSGNHPEGHGPKKNRLKTGPPGSTRGTCINLVHPGECFCGTHWKMSSDERKKLLERK